MTKPRDNSVWITLMYEVQKFMRDRLEQPEFMADLRRRMSSQELLKNNHLLDVAKPEINRAMELFIPGLLLDFLAQNEEILDREGLSRWASKMDDKGKS